MGLSITPKVFWGVKGYIRLSARVISRRGYLAEVSGSRIES